MYNDLTSNPSQKEQSLHTVSKTGSKFCEGLQFVDVEGLARLFLGPCHWVWRTPEHIHSLERVAVGVKTNPSLLNLVIMGNSLLQ